MPTPSSSQHGKHPVCFVLSSLSLGYPHLIIELSMLCYKYQTTTTACTYCCSVLLCRQRHANNTYCHNCTTTTVVVSPMNPTFSPSAAMDRHRLADLLLLTRACLHDAQPPDDTKAATLCPDDSNAVVAIATRVDAIIMLNLFLSSVPCLDY